MRMNDANLQRSLEILTDQRAAKPAHGDRLTTGREQRPRWPRSGGTVPLLWEGHHLFSRREVRLITEDHWRLDQPALPLLTSSHTL
jgi:hypothetical protein